MLVRPQVTRRNLYYYVFRYDERTFGGLPASAFREALTAEVGPFVSQPYEPLNLSPLYLPHTKRRYRLSDEHWRRIDPTRFELPVAERAHRSEAMIVSHQALLQESEELSVLPAAVRRLYDHAADLVDWQRATQAGLESPAIAE